MNEEFLHYIWKYKLLKHDLKTTNDDDVNVLNIGEHNHDAGPDFFNAKIKIGDTIWAGNVEIHIKSSDWIKHRHTNDAAYKNVILHVVYEHDTEIFNSSKKKIATLILKNRFNEKLYWQYRDFMKTKTWVACQALIKDVNPLHIYSWLERVLVERLERKTKEIEIILKQTSFDWEEAFYRIIARSFGFKVNSAAFEALSESLPLKNIIKHHDSLFQIEALLYGQSGLLNEEYNDEYSTELLREYNYLKNKFNLIPLDGSRWKFLRLRPANFPTIRISQFALLLYKTSKLFTYVREFKHERNIKELLNLKTSKYWETHYTFNKKSAFKVKKLGENSVNNILINAVVPFLFLYGEKNKQIIYKEKALNLLTSLPAETNTITSHWKKFGINVDTAFKSQAVIELKNSYCKQKKCLKCGVGARIIR